MKQSDLSPNIMTEVFKECIDYYGLKDFDVQTIRTTFENVVFVNLTKKIELTPLLALDNATAIRSLFDPITENIKESQAIKDLTTEYTLTIEVLRKQVQELMVEKSRLVPFETYYNLAFKLEHGEKS